MVNILQKSYSETDPCPYFCGLFPIVVSLLLLGHLGGLEQRARLGTIHAGLKDDRWETQYLPLGERDFWGWDFHGLSIPTMQVVGLISI